MKTLLIVTAISVFCAGMQGCATRGAGYVPLVDMQGKTTEAFNKDIVECQGYAKQRADAATGAVAGAVAGALLGAFLAPRGYKNHIAGKGAGLGALSGAGAANETQESITKRCLAGRGYNVLN